MRELQARYSSFHPGIIQRLTGAQAEEGEMHWRETRVRLLRAPWPGM